MSHGKLRVDKNCLNCGHHVEEKYCPNCGQQNIETRQPFYFLFTHFVEDFTHYDGQFWGTLKNLFFKPGKLTNTYLEGKRQLFVPPVKLYIFVSFITFFLFALFPPFEIDFNGGKKSLIRTEQFDVNEVKDQLNDLKAKKNLTKEDSASITKIEKLLSDSSKIKELKSTFDMKSGLGKDFKYKNFEDVKSYDAAKLKDPKFFDFIDKPFAHKFFELKEQGVSKADILKNFFETSFHNLPKALFIYLPVFAFFLWLFHNKKKWWYFEHGIFTLHYFSFLLLNILIFSFLNKTADLIHIRFISWILYLIMAAMVVYSVIYFFIAHRKVYHSLGVVSIVVGIVLFTINYIAFLFLVIGLALISFLTMH